MWKKLKSFLSRIFGFKRKEENENGNSDEKSDEKFSTECRVLECDIIDIEEIEENVEDSEENFTI